LSLTFPATFTTQDVVIDIIEERRDIDVHHPTPSFSGDVVAGGSHRIVRASPFAEPVAAFAKAGIKLPVKHL